MEIALSAAIQGFQFNCNIQPLVWYVEVMFQIWPEAYGATYIFDFEYKLQMHSEIQWKRNKHQTLLYFHSSKV